MENNLEFFTAIEIENIYKICEDKQLFYDKLYIERSITFEN